VVVFGKMVRILGDMCLRGKCPSKEMGLT
jgi:hypothetical protein